MRKKASCLFAILLVSVGLRGITQASPPDPVAPCAADEQNPDKQRVDDIKAGIEKAFNAWADEPEETRLAYDAKVRQILDPLTEDEIRLVARHVHDLDVEDEAFRRWARFDPAGALKAVRVVEDANAAEIRLAGTGLEGGPGDAMSGWVFGMYLAAHLHWSYVESSEGIDPFASEKEQAEQQAGRDRRHHDLGRAAGYWAARDFSAAWRWMKSYSGFGREGFPHDMLEGMSTSFDRCGFGVSSQARAHVLKQVAKLPDQTDRDQSALRFADVLGIIDDNGFIGEPPSDKAKWLESVRKSLSGLRLSPEATAAIVERLQSEGNSEQEGADPPATAPESKSESNEKPQSESDGRSR